MNLLYCSDMQGDFEALKSFRDAAEKAKPDVTIVSGDLIEGVFPEDEAKEYVKVSQELNKVKGLLNKGLVEHLEKDKSIKKAVPEEIFGKIMSDSADTFEVIGLANSPLVPIDIRSLLNGYIESVKPYKEFVKQGEASMREQYGRIKDVMAGVEFLTLPGNHDGDCLEDILGKENLHKKSREFNGIKFTGYGSSEMIPVATPRELIVSYNEGMRLADPNALIANRSDGVLSKEPVAHEGKLVAARIYISEPYKIFKAAKPQVAVAHNPPNGLYPSVQTMANGFNVFIEEEQPPLVLVGHIEDALGVAKSGRSYIVNPGSLNCKDRAGTYCELSLAKEGNFVRVDGIKVYKVKGNELVGIYKMNDDREPVFESDYAFPVVHTVKVQ